MDNLAGLTVVAGDKEPATGGETSRRIPDSISRIEDDVLNWTIDANRLAVQIRRLNARRRRLVALLDDPANADDPRRGEAEALVFRYKFERDELIAEFVKIAKRVAKRADEAGTGEPWATLVRDIGIYAYTSSVAYLVQRLPETKTIPFWVAVVSCGAASALDVVPF